LSSWIIATASWEDSVLASTFRPRSTILLPQWGHARVLCFVFPSSRLLHL
jgi:hypothetical protein